ncbi:hypothetical protein C8J56DRAFT_726674, partial [Mycena floridula]
RSTLQDRIHGKQSLSAFNSTKQKLTPAEESVLVEHILSSAERGFPMKHSTVVLHSNGIIHSCSGDLIDPESNWYFRFCDRH